MANANSNKRNIFPLYRGRGYFNVFISFTKIKMKEKYFPMKGKEKKIAIVYVAS